MAMAVNLPFDELRQLAATWRVRELALFGSVLRDDFRPESDIDILVTFDESAEWSLWDFVEMKNELEKLLGRRVDLVDSRGLDNPFRRREIMATKQVVYAAA